MLEAIADALGEQWGKTQELLATIAEILHALFLLTLKVNSKPHAQMPKPLRIRRPNQPAEQVMSIGEFARQLAQGR